MRRKGYAVAGLAIWLMVHVACDPNGPLADFGDSGQADAGACPAGQKCDDDAPNKCLECETDAACDDDNPCTEDKCIETCCVHSPLEEGAVCDDGLWCTVEEACAAGQCIGQSRNCDDDDLCTQDKCDESLKLCEHVSQAIPGAEGPFDDPTCENGIDDDCDGLTDRVGDPDCFLCTATADCDDGNTCTIDDCQEHRCIHSAAPSEVTCDDGLFCNGPDTCDNGTCVHAGLPCALNEKCDETSDGCLSPPWEDLLDQRVGFGRNAKGGQGGSLCTVTNLNDSGPGSLRECAKGPGPRWVNFAVSGEINLQSDIYVASRITIDGRGRQVTIQKYGLQVNGVSDLIIHNVRFEDGLEGDAIKVINQASRVWIDHVSLKSYGDGLLDITRASTDITVSWCRFEDHNKVMLISASVDHTDDKNIRVTIHHNYFNETVQRHPRLRYGKVHAYNNYLKKWTGYGMASSQDGQLLSEHNIFEAGLDKDAVICQAGEDPETGAVESRRDWQINGAIVDENDTEDVFEARDYYSYSKEDADSALRDKIKSLAGWQSVTFPSW